jgi:hypothetical protein
LSAKNVDFTGQMPSEPGIPSSRASPTACVVIPRSQRKQIPGDHQQGETKTEVETNKNAKFVTNKEHSFDNAQAFTSQHFDVAGIAGPSSPPAA